MSVSSEYVCRERERETAVSSFLCRSTYTQFISGYVFAAVYIYKYQLMLLCFTFALLSSRLESKWSFSSQFRTFKLSSRVHCVLHFNKERAGNVTFGDGCDRLNCSTFKCYEDDKSTFQDSDTHFQTRSFGLSYYRTAEKWKRISYD